MVQVLSGNGALDLDLDMQEELTKAFLELSASLKPAISSSRYKVLSDLYSALFRPPKVEEELTKSVGNTQPLVINPELERLWRHPIDPPW